MRFSQKFFQEFSRIFPKNPSGVTPEACLVNFSKIIPSEIRQEVFGKKNQEFLREVA